MKKLFKKALSVLMAVIMAVTSFSLSGIAAYAAISVTGSVVEDMLAAIQEYEAKMNGTLYTNMSAAYEAYVTACKYYDKYHYAGQGSYSVATQYTSALRTATANMQEWTGKITYVDSAADGSYSSSTLVSGTGGLGESNDEMSGVIYTYGMGSNSGYFGQSGVYGSDGGRLQLMMQYGSVVFLYTDDVTNYAVPINNINICTGGTFYTGRYPDYVAVDSSDVSGANAINSGNFTLRGYWHGGTTTTGYQTTITGTYAQSGYSYTHTVDSSTHPNGGSSQTTYFSNTLYYTGGQPSSTYTTQQYLEFFYRNNNSNNTYYIDTINAKNWKSTTNSETGTASAINKTSGNYNTSNTQTSNQSGAAASNIYVINYQKVLDAISEYVQGANYVKYFGLNSLAANGTYFRNGGLSTYYSAVDTLLSLNPTDSSSPYYIANSTSTDVASKVSSLAGAIDSSISTIKSAVNTITTDSGVYNNLRDDSDYVNGYTTQYDSQGNILYGINGLMATALRGNYTDEETGDTAYTADSWAIFLDAYKVAMATITYGANNSYNNSLPLASVGTTIGETSVPLYNSTKLENIDSGEYVFADDKYLSDDGYYYLKYDADSNNIVTADEAVKALTLAYKNLKLNYSVVDAALLQALILEAQTLIKASDYFTDTTYQLANLSSVISAAQEAVWGGADNFGIDASLLKNTTENQAIVDGYVEQLVYTTSSGINQLKINTAKTVASAGGYSLNSAINYCKTLTQSEYTNWNEVLQPVLDEANYYLTAKSNDTSDYGTSRNVEVNTESAQAVSGSAYQYILDYINLVERLNVGILSLQVAFTAIQNMQIANTGATQTDSNRYTYSSSKLWDLSFKYNKGMIFFRTTNAETVFDLEGATLTFGSSINYDQMLDSISLNAKYLYDGSSYMTGSDHYTIYEGTGSGWSLVNQGLLSRWPAATTYTTSNGTFTLSKMQITTSTGRNTHLGYGNYVNGEVETIDSQNYDFTDLLNVTDGYGGSVGDIRGGVLTHSNDDDNTRGYAALTANYTYTLPAYTKQTLSASTVPTLTQENTDLTFGGVYYAKYVKTVSTYYGYQALTFSYNPNVSVIDVTYLFDLINIYSTLDSTHYTTSSWAAYEKAYQAAIANMDYTKMTATEIYNECKTRYSNLWTAYQGLQDIVTLKVINCKAATIDVNSQSDFTYSYVLNDDGTVTFNATSLPDGWYIDNGCTLTVAQGGTINLTIHTQCTTTVTRVAAHCSQAGYTRTLTTCAACSNPVQDVTVPIEATGEHNYGDWYYTKYATNTETGTMQRDCQNTWTDENGETVACDHFETKEVAAKIYPTLCVDNKKIENGEITFEYPTEISDKAFAGNQYYIDFEYTGTAPVLEWDVLFTAAADSDGTDVQTGWVEGTDYILLQGEDYTYSDNDNNTHCVIIFRSTRAQTAWDNGCVIINANTAVFPVRITAVDCEENDVTADISYTIYNSDGAVIGTNTKGTVTGLTYDSDENMYYFTNMAGTYTVVVTDTNGYTLDDDSVTVTTSGDKAYDDLGLVFHKDVEEYQSVTDPTCTKQGYTTYITSCTICDTPCKTEIKDYVPALGHSYQINPDSDLAYEATCTQDGQIVYTCERCGDTYIGIDYSTGHIWQVKETVASDCTTAGHVTYECTKCGGEKTVELQKTAHSYTATVTAPTCTQPGYTTYTCDNCGETYTGAGTAATGHAYRIDTESSVAATCQSLGYNLYVCKYCVESITVGEATETSVLTCGKDPDVETDNDIVLKCDLKEHTHTDECYEDGNDDPICGLDEHEHTDDCYESVAHEHTDDCFTPAVELEITDIQAKDGQTVVAEDGGSYYVETLQKTEHNWDDGTVTKEATCTEDGEITYTCTNIVGYEDDGEPIICGETKVEKISSDSAHEWVKDEDKSTEPTCTEDGIYYYECSLCHKTYDETVAALGHDLDDGTAVAATCEEQGYTLYTCQRDGCDYTEKTVTTAATGHAYRIDTENSADATCGAAGYYLLVCKNCVESVTVNSENTVITYDAVICGEEAHTHTDDCYNTDGELTCTLTEHEHSEDCYGTTVTLDIELTAKDGAKLYDYDGGSYKVVVVEATGKHNYELNKEDSEYKEATCTEDGLNVYVCTVCGDRYTEVTSSADAHKLDDGTVTKDPTCTEEGEMTYKCTVDGCDYTTTAPIPATGHDYAVEAVAPTCEAKGYNLYVCKNCAAEYTTETDENGNLIVKDADGNVLSEREYDKDGNVTVEGSYYTVVTTAETGHSYRINTEYGKAATCTEAGYELYVCQNCAKSVTVNDATEGTKQVLTCGYEEGEEVEELTCEEDHEHTDDCYTVTKHTHSDDCYEDEATITLDIELEANDGETLYNYDGGSYYVKVIQPTGHNWGEWVVTDPATCTTTGTATHTCSECKETETKVIPTDDGHDYVLSTNPDDGYVAATCEKGGVNVYVCQLCQDPSVSYTEETPALGHSYEKATSVDPTCEVMGYDLYICTNCVDSYSFDENGSLVVCDKDGNVLSEREYNEKGEITNQGSYYKVDTVAATGHSYRLYSTVPSTCVQSGYELYVCRNCVETAVVNSATEGTKQVLTCGYEEGEEVKERTCEEDHEHTDSCYTATEHTHTADCYTDETTITLDVALTAIEGKTVYNKDGGSYKVVVLDKADHTWDSGTITKEATCTETGVLTYTCTVDGCTATKPEIIPMVEHSLDNGTITVKPTCTKTGEIVYKCENCTYEETAVLEALGHSYTVTSVEPTCTEAGYDLYVCDNCVDSYTVGDDGTITPTPKDGAEIIDTTYDKDGNIETAGSYYTVVTKAATGHQYRVDEEKSTAATCTTAGATVYVCKTCGDTYSEAIEAGTGAHSYDYENGVVTPPTCTEKGYTTYTCTECGEELVANIVAATGHSYGEWEVTTPATHLAEGVKTRTCACGDTQTATIAKTADHEYKAVKTAATCTTPGYTTYTCACGATYTSDAVAALGHDYSTSKVTTPATHTSTGTLTEYCSRCSATRTSTIAKTTAHSYKAVETKPTCTSRGYTTYTCACGATYKGNYTSATGHNYEFTKYSVKATRNKDGQALYTCSDCGKTKTKSYAKIASWGISITSYTYDGNKVVPKITVKDADGNTISSKYYCYQYYAENTANLVGTIRVVGKYYVKVTFKTKYSGSIVVGELTVKPKTRSISSLTAASKGFTVKWSALKSTQISGYQIQYSTDKNFSSKKTVTVSGNSKSSKKITGLKANKKYYVRIRTYKKNNGVTYYSSWSSAKTVTTKK